MSRRLGGGALALLASLATLAGCELVVDDGTRVLVPVDAGADGPRPSADTGALDVAPPDVAQRDVAQPDVGKPDVGPGPDCASTCTDTVTSCRQTCTSTLASCMAACPPGHGMSCQDQCTQMSMQCGDTCGSQCVACFMQAGCPGASACSG